MHKNEFGFWVRFLLVYHMIDLKIYGLKKLMMEVCLWKLYAKRNPI